MQKTSYFKRAVKRNRKYCGLYTGMYFLQRAQGLYPGDTVIVHSETGGPSIDATVEKVEQSGDWDEWDIGGQPYVEVVVKTIHGDVKEVSGSFLETVERRNPVREVRKRKRD